MPVKKAQAIWDGELKTGKGTMEFESGAFKGAYTFASRFEDGVGTNPEELIGAALAGCFSMALSGDLGKQGYKPASVKTDADVSLEMVDGAPTITTIQLTVQASVPEIKDEEFQEIANKTKKNCPVSRALKANIMLKAELKA
ncbi:MAG: OsmC family protein [Balneolaceae bacterium]